MSTDLHCPDASLDIPENNLAALDIGSNSFHFVLARVVDNNLQILHSEKYQVKLASGLDEDDILDQTAIDRGLQTLSDLAITAAKLNADNFRVVATYTLRQAKNARAFLQAAAEVFPFDIEIISGHEEARLIYQGVAHYSPPDEKRLVIDIGGGSTECVIGKNYDVLNLSSVNIGCVSFKRRFFSDDTITAQAFDRAILFARMEIEALVNRFRKTGWQQALGTSGTIKSIYQIINASNNAENELPRPIKLSDLNALKQQLIEFGHTDNIELANLKESRKAILCPGLAILIALVDMLKITEIDYCDYALREGVLCEQLEQQLDHDSRARTITSLQSRFNVDTEQADKVATSALAMFDAVNSRWQLPKKNYRDLLNWSIQVHEIGLDINPSGYHKHSKYILQNADLPGFNQEQMQALAWLVGNQRKKINSLEENNWYLLNQTSVNKILVLMRLSVLLSQQRQLSPSPIVELKVDENSVTLTFEQNWLNEKPLIYADLQLEQEYLQNLAIELKIETCWGRLNKQGKVKK